MIKEEILNMPAGREMDALVAERVMGKKLCKHEATRGRKVCIHCHLNKAFWVKAIPPEYYSTSISAAWQVEEKMKELKLRNKYSLFLRDVIWHDTKLDTDSRSWWLIHATPHQRCQAALSTIMEEK